MEPWQITVLVLCIIIAFYLLIVITDIVFVCIFRHIFKKHNVALKILLMRKYDAVRTLFDLLAKLNVPVEFKYIKMFQDIDPTCFDSQTSDCCKSAKETFSILKNQIGYMIRSDEILMKHNEIQEAMKSFHEMDSNYRTLVGAYNADVLGYNYWIHFLPTRYIYNWLKVEPKEMI